MSVEVVVAGAGGRMGQAILRALEAADGIATVAALERPGHPDLGTDAAVLAGATARGVSLSDDVDAALQPGRVVVDFSAPEATVAMVARAAAAGCRAVIGTTGLTDAQHAAIADAAGSTAVLYAPNMSVGVNVLFGLLARAARALGRGWDMEIVELHHRRKKDAPSGTSRAHGGHPRRGPGLRRRRRDPLPGRPGRRAARRGAGGGGHPWRRRSR